MAGPGNVGKCASRAMALRRYYNQAFITEFTDALQFCTTSFPISNNNYYEYYRCSTLKHTQTYNSFAIVPVQNSV